LQFKHISYSFEPAVRDDSGKYRVYKTPQGNQYSSVTSMVSKTKSEKDKAGITRWQSTEPAHEYITHEAIEIGNQTHQLIEDYLNNQPTITNYDLLSFAHFERIRDNFLHKITEVHGIEVQLYSDKLKLAGTADCVGMYDGNLSIIDYKTKRSDQRVEYIHDYFIQTSIYATMWEELTGIPINQVVILVSSRKGQLKEFIEKPDNFLVEIKKRLQMYNS